MKKTLLALAVVTPFIAYPLASWVIGGQVENVFQRQYSTLKDNSYFAIVDRKVERGIFTTEETLTFALKPELIAQFQVLDAEDSAKEAVKPIQFVVRSHVNHGPFPAFKRMGLASAHSEVLLDYPEITKLYGGESPLIFDTQIDFNGGGQQQLHSPSVEGRVDELDVSWGEFVMSTDFDSSFTTFNNMKGSLPFVKIHFIEPDTEALSTIDIKGISFEGQQKLLSGQIYTGPLKFNIQKVTGVTGQQTGFLMEKLEFKSDVVERTGFVDVLAGYKIDSINVGEQLFKNAYLDLAFRHFERAALVDFDKAANSMNGALLTDGVDALKSMLPPLQKLLENSPEISIERLGITTPQGDVKVSALVKLPNANVGNLEAAVENPLLLMGLASVLQADAQIALPEVLLKENLTPEQTEMLATMIQSGYVLNKSGQLSTVFKYSQGDMTINGKPLDPAMMGGK